MQKSFQNVQSDSTTSSNKYHPSDIENFLPWACIEMGTGAASVIITRFEQNPYTSSTISSRRAKNNKFKEAQTPEIVSPVTKTQPHGKSSQPSVTCEDVIKINCVYNSNNQLVKIKFCKNKKVPKYILKLLAIALPYHPHLTSIQVDGGLHPDLIFELGRIVAISNITEVILDNTRLEDAVVHILLEENVGLKHLSLARCTLNDDMVEALASKLIYPLPTSKKLCVLNLSSNRITDIGAKCLGNALRTNRQLAYLNLSGNMIGDAGADSILDSLKEFSLTADELKDMKTRRFQYLKQENNFQSNRLNEVDKKSMVSNKKVTKPVSRLSLKKNARKIDEIYKDTECTNQTSGTSTTNGIYFDKCEVSIKDMLGPFEDPFRPANIIIEKGVTYCLGNNTLCYLSLAYNYLNYFSVKKLCTILRAQRKLNRQPRGLINVSIEGNNIPSCAELKEINFMIESSLNAVSKVSLGLKKKVIDKFSAR